MSTGQNDVKTVPVVLDKKFAVMVGGKPNHTLSLPGMKQCVTHPRREKRFSINEATRLLRHLGQLERKRKRVIPPQEEQKKKVSPKAP